MGGGGGVDDGGEAVVGVSCSDARRRRVALRARARRVVAPPLERSPFRSRSVHDDTAHAPPRPLLAPRRCDLGPIFVIFTGFACIYFGLGTRQPGEASAYSVFNNFVELPGTYNAAQLEDQLRHRRRED